MQHAVALAPGVVVRPEDLPEKIRERPVLPGDGEVGDPTHMITIAELERRYIQRVLQAVDGNKTLASKILGIERRTLYRKLERQN
jgi:transcriptional regulator of acetoin/glycerol metabolism